MKRKLNYTNKILLFNISGSFIIKGCSIVIGFLTTPAYIKYFDNAAVLGIWFTVLSILNWIMMFDLGIGNGLRNRLAKSIADNDEETAQKQISSAYIILGIVSLVFFTIGEIVISSANWNVILNVNTSIISDKVLTLSVMVLYGGIVLQFWLKLITSILLAMRKTMIPGVLMIITNICIVIFLRYSICIPRVEDRLISLSIFYLLALNLPLIITTVILFSTKLKKIIPTIRFFDKNEANKVLNMGGIFFIIQIALLIISSTNEWLISFLYDAKSVVDYQIYYKIFNLFLVLFSLITQPIWSSITIEYEKGNIEWIRKIYKTLVYVVCLSIPLLIIMVLNFNSIVNIWVGKGIIEVEFYITLSFAIYTIIMMAINCSTCIANGIGKLKCQLYCFTVAAILKFPLSFLLSKYFDNWIIILWINIVVLIPLLFIQPIILKRNLKEAIISITKNNY